jgi:hypothetical protein
MARPPGCPFCAFPGTRIDIYKLSFISHSAIAFCQQYNHRPVFSLTRRFGNLALSKMCILNSSVRVVRSTQKQFRCFMVTTGSTSSAPTTSSASAATLDLWTLPHSSISRPITVLLFLAEVTTSGESPDDVQSKDLCLDSFGRSMFSRTCFLSKIRQSKRSSLIVPGIVGSSIP